MNVVKCSRKDDCMVSLKMKKGGGFEIERYFKKLSSFSPLSTLHKYGAMGVAALSDATPTNTGETANSWHYEISSSKNSYRISWTNDHVVDQIPVVILIQYGHATKNGGYVKGIDFINPALRPIFEAMAEDVWKEITNL